MTFLVFIMRFLVFDLQESSKYFIAKGRDEEAIEVRPMLLISASPIFMRSVRFCNA